MGIKELKKEISDLQIKKNLTPRAEPVFGEYDLSGLTSPCERVDHPAHYNQGIEVIDFIESHNLDFNAGNVVKYISRYKHKDNPMEDLQKAKWYIERMIKQMEKQ
jgi:hypothetical protein